jgi:choline dehydrogenase-like flavoprotein
MLSYQPNNEEGHKRLQAQLRRIMGRLGCEMHAVCYEHFLPQNAYIGKRIPLAGVAHQNGTLRFGTDPRTSVLDVNCRAHDLDNLYAVDASFFPSSGAVNPALTVMANALRVGDPLLERLHATRAAAGTAMPGLGTLSPARSTAAVPA